MQTAERPQRNERTPDTEAAYVLTFLQDKFVELAGKSKTWPAELDPEEFFVNKIYGPMKKGEDLDADREKNDFLECCKSAAERGEYVDDGLVQMVFVATAYCVQAQTAYLQGKESFAWSLIADAHYWHGLLKVDAGNKPFVQASSGGHARWKDSPEAKEKDFIFECWKDWRANPDKYKSQAAFARSMLDKCEHLQSQKVIEDWCRAWKRSAY